MLHTKFMTASGMVSTVPFWYFGCIIVREDKTKSSSVTAYAGSNALGAPIWKYTLGETDARAVRLMREAGDEVLLEGAVYAEISPDTTFIVHYRPLGG